MPTLPKIIDISIGQTLKTLPQFKMISDKWSHDINIKCVSNVCSLLHMLSNHVGDHEITD